MLLVAALELGAHWFFAARYPRFEEYEAISRAGIAPEAGEALVVAPEWAEPMGRRAFGEALAIAAVAGPDFASVRTVVEVDVLGHRRDELSGWREIARESVGPFTLRRLENPAASEVAVDFVAALGPAARVELHALGTARCDWHENADLLSGGLGGNPTFPRRRFVCPGAPFLNAGVTVIADEEFRARRCIWAHPPPRGVLAIRFPPLALGARIVGHGGIYWMIERERAGAPVELAVTVDGDAIGRVVHEDGEGWARFELPLGEHAGRRGAVSFLVSSVDWHDRHFCFEARSLEAKR